MAKRTSKAAKPARKLTAKPATPATLPAAKRRAKGFTLDVDSSKLGTAATIEYQRNGKTYRHSFTTNTPLVYAAGHLIIPALLTRGNFIR